MKIKFLTLFPEIVAPFFSTSIMQKAIEKNIISYNLINIRDFAFNKHKNCDDIPYGGGAGMVLMAKPLSLALESQGVFPKSNIEKRDSKRLVIFPSPSGRPLTQEVSYRLSAYKELVFICGRYEGIDQRIIDSYVDEEISIGDYVLSSGEVAALVIVDSVYRLIEGVISKESLSEESFCDGLLEYPQYTRPSEFLGLKVPEVLTSGDHKKINQWRLEKRIEKTLTNRPDLYQKWESENQELLAALKKAADKKAKANKSHQPID